jgi:CRP-like cAMP-binding protein
MNDSNLHTQYLKTVYQYFKKYIDISPELFDQLTPYFEIRKFDKKAVVTGLGETEGYYNLLMKGLVRKYLPIKKNELILQLCIEGQMIQSEISFNQQQPSVCIIETIEPSTFLSVSYANVQLIYERFPQMERLGRLILTELFIKKDFRDFKQLNKSTRERFLDYMQANPGMLQRVPQKYLASYLNIKPETFSRLKHLIAGSKLKS